LVGLPGTPLDQFADSRVGGIAVALGAVFTLMAILGFEALSKFAGICSPWLFVVFVAAAVATLPKLGVSADLSNLWEVCQRRSGTDKPPRVRTVRLLAIVFFAWFCNRRCISG